MRKLTALLLLFGLLASPALAEPTSWETMKKQREELEGQSTQARASEAQALAELFQLNRTLQQMQAEIKRLGDEVAVVEGKRTAAQAEGARLKAQLELRQEQFGTRARYFHERGNMGFLQVLLSAASLSDFISRLDLISLVMERDLTLIREVRTLRAQVEEQHARLTQISAELKSLHEQEEAKKRDLEVQIARKEERLAGLKEQRAGVEAELARIEAVWTSEAMPVLMAFGNSFHTLALRMREIQPDSVQFTFVPPSATIKLSEKNLNEFLARNEELKTLQFRLKPGTVAMVGRFSHVELEITGAFEVVGKTVLRYRPKGIAFHGFRVPESVLDELVKSGRLDVELRDLINPLSIQEIRVEDGFLYGQAGAFKP